MNESKLMNSGAGHPWGRGKIERFLGQLATSLESCPGYIVSGGDETAAEPESEHLLTLEELETRISEVITSWNERRFTDDSQDDPPTPETGTE